MAGPREGVVTAPELGELVLPSQAQLPSFPQRPPAVHLRQSVPAGCKGCGLGPAGLRSVLDGAPRCQPGPVAARHPVLPAEGVNGPAAPVGRTVHRTKRRWGLAPEELLGATPSWGSRPSHSCPPPPRPNKESFNCSELRLPSSPPLSPAGAPQGSRGSQGQDSRWGGAEAPAG